MTDDDIRGGPKTASLGGRSGICWLLLSGQFPTSRIAESIHQTITFQSMHPDSFLKRFGIKSKPVLVLRQINMTSSKWHRILKISQATLLCKKARCKQENYFVIKDETLTVTSNMAMLVLDVTLDDQDNHTAQNEHSDHRQQPLEERQRWRRIVDKMFGWNQIPDVRYLSL